MTAPGGSDQDGVAADVSVVICTYTPDRWEQLCAAVDSVLAQTCPPRELFVTVDHNPELFETCRRQWGGRPPAGGVPIRIVENRYAGHLGAARTTASELATGTVIAFLDDDAAAEPDWLAHMVPPFDDPTVVAVGGRPLPVFSTARPRWFPPEYDWVFGCAYVGLPTSPAPILRVIGASMAVRRSDLAAIGYFHSDDHDDMDMCHRLLHRWPGGTILFEPDAVVHHHVPPGRVTWSYFWRRCFHVNRGKAAAFREMGAAGSLAAERRFARRALTDGTAAGRARSGPRGRRRRGPRRGAGRRPRARRRGLRRRLGRVGEADGSEAVLGARWTATRSYLTSLLQSPSVEPTVWRQATAALNDDETTVTCVCR